MDCHDHNYQLIVRDGLLILDAWLMDTAGMKYFSTLAKLMNTLREYAWDIWSYCERRNNLQPLRYFFVSPHSALVDGGGPSQPLRGMLWRS